MNGFVTLTSSAACWHDSAQVSEGPTTHQRNWWCPACGATRTTFPGDSAEAHFATRAAPPIVAFDCDAETRGQGRCEKWCGRAAPCGALVRAVSKPPVQGSQS